MTIDADLSWIDGEPNWRTVKRSMLEDGSVLRDRIRRTNAGDPDCSLFMTYSVIRDSEFSVPFEGSITPPGLDPDSVQEGDIIVSESEARIRPAFLENGSGDRFLPLFTSWDQTKGSFDDCATVLTMPFAGCVDIARKAGMEILIDAFTDMLYLSMEHAEFIATIPTRIADRSRDASDVCFCRF